jgi:alpha-1,6-mannosyltransferase
MKIIDVAEFYAELGGGVRTYINQKLEAGARAGHEVVVVAPGPEDGEEERSGGRICWVKGPPMPLDPRYYVLWREEAVHRILDREAPDVVEGSSPWSGGWFVARWSGRAVKTFIFHQDPVAVYPQTFLGHHLGIDRVDQMFSWYWAYLRSLSARFDATVVSGEWLAEKLHRFGLHRAEAVPFGIDKAQFSPSLRDPVVRKQMLERCGVGEEASLLVNISRFHPEKRLGTLLAAFRRASARRPMGLVIYGDGPLRRWVERNAARVPGVHLAGFVSDRDEIAKSLASADAMLHGSSAETYGLVVAEAVCSGLPIIVPNQGGAADLADPSYAETYAPGDVADCSAAIETLLARDRDVLVAGCARAAQREIGTMDDHFDQLFELYERLVEEASQAKSDPPR